VLHSLAQSIHRLRLAPAAILLLEAARPFAFVLSQALLVASPIVGPVTRGAPDRLARLLDNPRRVDALRDLLEADDGPVAGKGG